VQVSDVSKQEEQLLIDEQLLQTPLLFAKNPVSQVVQN